MIIRGYYNSLGQDRNICLIPTSAHGTNPASAVMSGMKIVSVICNENGDINFDINDLGQIKINLVISKKLERKDKTPSAAK